VFWIRAHPPNPRPILLSALIQSPLRPVVDRRLVVCHVCHVCQLDLAGMDVVSFLPTFCESAKVAKAAN
jgi:hypothetical protein